MAKILRVDLGLIASDEFLERPFEAQLLYFHLLLNKDSNGIVNNPKAIQRMLGVSEGALTTLCVNGYLVETSEVGEFFVVDTLETFLEVNSDGNQESS